MSLKDALGLLALDAAEDSPKYERAALRWPGRRALESDDITLDDLQLAAAALQSLPRRPKSSMRSLADICRESPASRNAGLPTTAMYCGPLLRALSEKAWDRLKGIWTSDARSART